MMSSNLWKRISAQVSEVPGTKVKEALVKAGLPLDSVYPLAERAEGVWIQDIDGNVIMDFISGRCTVNCGHNHPRLLKAVQAQVEKVTHGLTPNRLQLLESLKKVSPFKGEEQALTLALSGSAANDAAMKLARSYTRRQNFIAFAGAYHGTTFGAMALSSYVTRMKEQFYPMVPGVCHMPFPHCFRCPFGHKSNEECGMACLDYITKYAAKTYCPPSEIAAVIMEPIAGDAGWLVPPKEFVVGIRKWCSENGILYISEEVQAGYGRAGEWWGVNLWGVEPDAIVLGKAMAGGMAPMSGVLYKSELGKNGFYHGHTMGGHPVGCAASIANIDVIRDERLCEASKKMGKHLMSRLEKMKDNYEPIIDVRGRGLLIGVEIGGIHGHTSKEVAGEICKSAFRKGLYIIEMGSWDTGVLRVAPPLVITGEQADWALNTLEEAVRETLRKYK